MAKVIEKVYSLGDFWQLTEPSVQVAKQMVAKEQVREGMYPNVFMTIDERIEYNNNFDRENDKTTTLNEKMNELAALLKQAGIKKKDFPFDFTRDKNGMILDFTPKGKNKEEIQQNIMAFKDKVQEAFDQGKIKEEEYDSINETLKEMMEEKDIQLEEENIQINVDEIEANLKGLVAEVYGDIEHFEKDCENYDNMDLEDRKFKLDEFNSKINTRLGIKGDLKFSKDPNMKFEKSFIDKGNGGYYLTEKEVGEKGLKSALYNMMEKSMIREKEIKSGITLSEQRKKEQHKKITEHNLAKQKRAKQRSDAKKAQKMRTLFRNME